MGDPLLSIRLGRGRRLRRQLKHCCRLTLAQERQQHGAPIWKFERIVMCHHFVFVDLSKDGRLVAGYFRTRLLQRVRAGEGVDHRERTSDPGEIQKRRGVYREVFCSRSLAPEADVGERDLVAVAIAAGGGAFERGQGVSSRYSTIASDSNRIGPSPSIKAGSAIIGLTARYAASRCAPFMRFTSTTSSGTTPLRLSAMRTR
jgi:hypothetical protein